MISYTGVLVLSNKVIRLKLSLLDFGLSLLIDSQCGRLRTYLFAVLLPELVKVADPPNPAALRTLKITTLFRSDSRHTSFPLF